MSLSIQTLGRSIAVAAITAGALVIGTSTAGAEPVAPAPQPAASQQLATNTDPAAHSVTATLPVGQFISNEANHSIDIADATGKVVESFPMTLRGEAVPVAATVSNDGKTLNLKQVAFTDTANQLVNEWVWGVQHGGAVGAIIGCLLGFWFFVVPGCAVGAAIGGTLGSPNGGEINATFFRLLSGN
ncbi:hypothetical protein NONO_c56820 [Nocardia nova SH22a]|uniref:DUF8020 domain-containing protein n=1 Tax=Nocardia nova SH22a TaxID=1415166 RepID=W5TM87_9NOCA|nr:hypothetical protein [Nocardia nova]AHH20460.1 hypothetical protein NONO_c56820 [Nocardia nova SH22a]